jgi:hypothetical protein
MMKHVTQPVPDIRQINQSVPDLLVAVAKKALAKDPTDRYQTASDMGLALRAIDMPESAAEETILPKAQQSVDSTKIGSVSAVLPPAPEASKSGLPAWLVGLVTFVLVLGLGLGLFFYGPAPIKLPRRQKKRRQKKCNLPSRRATRRCLHPKRW